jgi:hypothetical protein
MNKTDNRHYNRRENRRLNIEVDLWIMLGGKHIVVPGAFYDSKPVSGTITDLDYTIHNSGNYARLRLDNGAEYSVRVKHGKPIFNPSTIIKTSSLD